MDLFISRGKYVSNFQWLGIVRKHYDELCDKISRSSLPLETDAVDIIFQHMLRHGSLYSFAKVFFCKF